MYSWFQNRALIVFSCGAAAKRVPVAAGWFSLQLTLMPGSGSSNLERATMSLL